MFQYAHYTSHSHICTKDMVANWILLCSFIARYGAHAGRVSITSQLHLRHILNTFKCYIEPELYHIFSNFWFWFSPGLTVLQLKACGVYTKKHKHLYDRSALLNELFDPVLFLMYTVYSKSVSVQEIPCGWYTHSSICSCKFMLINYY